MILLDTGYFIALFTPDDDLHERAAAWSLHLNSFALMGERGLKCALAYDQHFEQAGFEALLRRDPPAS